MDGEIALTRDEGGEEKCLDSISMAISSSWTMLANDGEEFAETRK